MGIPAEQFRIKERHPSSFTLIYTESVGTHWFIFPPNFSGLSFTEDEVK